MIPTKVVPFIPDSTESRSAMGHYQTAYFKAKAASDLANSIKYTCLMGAGFVFMASILIRQSVRSERSGFPVLSLSMVIGALLVVVIADLWSRLLERRARSLRRLMESAVTAGLLQVDGGQTLTKRPPQSAGRIAAAAKNVS